MEGWRDGRKRGRWREEEFRNRGIVRRERRGGRLGIRIEGMRREREREDRVEYKYNRWRCGKEEEEWRRGGGGAGV